MSRPKLKSVIGARRWETIRDQWLTHVPSFQSAGTAPQPGLEHLPGLQHLTIPDNKDRHQFDDVSGVRSNMLSEAVFLFHKCAHTHLAAQRLGEQGMHSWSMFNAYHSGYLGARGIMALLGIGFPTLPYGGQFMIDVFPPPETRKAQKELLAGNWVYAQFLAVRFGKGLDQVEVWDALERTLNVCEVACWTAGVCDEVRKVIGQGMTKTRNAFLYKSAFWPPLGDLLTDGGSDDFAKLIGTRLDTEEQGFLLRLSYDVYRLFEDLMVDFSGVCDPVRRELRESRVMRDPVSDDLLCYNAFLVNCGLGVGAV